MTNDERRQKIDLYGHAHTLLVEGLQRFPKEMWKFKPSPQAWSIHETIVHIADSEANSYARCRRFIAEPGSTVMAYDENQWARALRYHEQSTDEALELFKWLRHSSHVLVQDLPEAVWANTINHPESGLLTMDDWLDIYARHIPEHLKQMQAVYEVWKR
jgi:hypothetical protein